MKISIFGSGYVGLVTGACLASLGHDVICVDVDEKKIKVLEEGKIPFYEPGLQELLASTTQKGRLRFTTNPQEAIWFGEVIFNCVGTPSREDGSANLTYVFAVAEAVGKYTQGYKVFVNKSTVPPGTAKKCDEVIKNYNPSSTVDVVSNPEFLAEGKAVYDFSHPDKIVIGTKSERAFNALKRVYLGRVRSYIPVLETDWETAEMIKYANNSFLATKISFINEVANICDRVGADVKIVAQAMGLDYRINPRFLNPGVGYGGSCFPKDVRALVQVAKERGYDAALLRQVNDFNERQKKVLLQKLKERFGSTISGKTVTVWGLSFKPKTSDIREAPSLTLLQELSQLGVTVKVYDPLAVDETKAHFRDTLGSSIMYSESLQHSVQGSSALLLVTEWDEFRNVNLGEIGKLMTERVLFDGRNIYEPELVREDGFEYYGVGRK